MADEDALKELEGKQAIEIRFWQRNSEDYLDAV
jgi:hypothetical protein